MQKQGCRGCVVQPYEDYALVLSFSRYQPWKRNQPIASESSISLEIQLKKIWRVLPVGRYNEESQPFLLLKQEKDEVLIINGKHPPSRLPTASLGTKKLRNDKEI